MYNNQLQDFTIITLLFKDNSKLLQKEKVKLFNLFHNQMKLKIAKLLFKKN